MSAKEMFEELGYKLLDKVCYKTHKLKYYKDDDNVILFYDETEYSPKGFIKSGEYDGMCDDITMQELKAINKQCEELGWIESEV